MIRRLLTRRRAPSAAERTDPVPADLLRKVKRIEISTKRLVDEGVAGDYHAVFKGRGMEFSEVRPYQAGDDVRTIDWNVTARMGNPFVKTFIEERDLNLFLAIDISGSLSFGSRTILKRELAAEIAALLSFSALRNNDRVGAALVSDRLEVLLRPRRSRTHVLRLVREILGRGAAGRTDLDRGLNELLRTLKQRSVLFLISDFVDAAAESAIKAAATRHDLIVIEIYDPRDDQLPNVGPVPLRDAETGRVRLISGARAANEHRARRERERHQLRQLTRRLNVDLLEVRTDRPYLSTLVQFFDRRRRRLAR